MVDFIEEVEEQLRSDRYRALAWRLAPWFIAALVALVLGWLGVWGWQVLQARNVGKASAAYDKALARGWPISTGVIEGACRHLIKDQLDITGARWGPDGAEVVLRLRALRSSGDFETYWAYHEARDYQRNHLTRYKNGILPETAEP